MPHYTVEEVAEILNRPIGAVLLEITEGRLIPSVGLGPMRGSFWTASAPPYIYRGVEEGWDWDGERTTADCSLVNSDTWYLPTCAYQNIYHDDNNAPYIHILQSFLSLQRDTGLWFGPEELLEREDDRVYLSDLVINDEELTRFVQVAGTAHIQDNLSTRERNNLLREIGILVRLYVEAVGGNRLGTPDAPNISQVVEDILLHASNHNLSQEGLGNSTLRARIRDALESIESTADAS